MGARRASRGLRAVALLCTGALLLAACDRDEGPEVETARVGSGEVVETVAAAAELEPAARVPVTAPAGGEVVELHVEDGDEVEEGDLLLRLRSDNIELQIAQAEAALQSADAMAGLGGAGVDISPLFGAVRGQLEAVLPPVLDSLEQQAAQVERDDARERLETSIGEARRSYESSVAELRLAERDSRGQAQQAEAAQRRAAEAQREQARLALEAAESREDELVVTAPRAGVVELGRVGGGGGAGLDGLGAPGGIGSLGDLGGMGDAAGLEGLEGLAPPADEDTRELVRGAEVSAGQTLMTIYDLSSFSARVQVDEIDVVEVEEGQRAIVLIDAYPDAELGGHVASVALSPQRGSGGGATFGVRVEFTDVPDDVRLRVGLTASSEIVVREVDGETVVPTSALLRRGREDLVRVVRDGVVHDVGVEVQAIGDQRAAVAGDLEQGELVVTLGVDQLADGDEVAG